MKWTISFIALFFIMLTACKKQAEPLLVDGNIVFLLSGLMNDESKQIEDSEVIKLEKKEGNFLRENMDDILISIFVIIILVSIKKFTLNKSTGN